MAHQGLSAIFAHVQIKCEYARFYPCIFAFFHLCLSVLFCFVLLFPVSLFPTSLCEVLVFGSVSCPPPLLFFPPVLRHTNFHTTFSYTRPHFCHTHNFVTHTSLSHTTLSHSIFHTQLCHTHLCHTQLCHTPSFAHNFVTHIFVTHNLVTHIFVTHSFLTHNFVTHNFVTHTHAHTIFHTQLCHTHLVSHNFVTHHLCHTTWSHTFLAHTHSFATHTHTQLCHTQLCHTHTHHLSHTTFSHTHLCHTTWSHTSLSHATLSHTIFARLAWWPLATSTLHLRGRRSTWRHPPTPTLCVAGLALGDTSTALCVARMCHLWHGGALSRGCVAGVALGDIDVAFAWEACRLAGSTYVCVAGMALMALGCVWWRASGRAGAAAPCVAGVALGDIHLHFSWQAWRLATSTYVLRGRRGTYGTGLGLVVRLGGAAALCVASVALGDIHLHFAWQVWHLATFAYVLCGRRGAYGTRRSTLRGRRGTWRHRPWFGVAGVALGDIHLHFAWQAWHLATSTYVLRGRRDTYGYQGRLSYRRVVVV